MHTTELAYWWLLAIPGVVAVLVGIICALVIHATVKRAQHKIEDAMDPSYPPRPPGTPDYLNYGKKDACVGCSTGTRSGGGVYCIWCKWKNDGRPPYRGG